MRREARGEISEEARGGMRREAWGEISDGLSDKKLVEK
jgi:hypothetical protein